MTVQYSKMHQSKVTNFFHLNGKISKYKRIIKVRDTIKYKKSKSSIKNYLKKKKAFHHVQNSPNAKFIEFHSFDENTLKRVDIETNVFVATSILRLTSFPIHLKCDTLIIKKRPIKETNKEAYDLIQFIFKQGKINSFINENLSPHLDYDKHCMGDDFKLLYQIFSKKQMDNFDENVSYVNVLKILESFTLLSLPKRLKVKTIVYDEVKASRSILFKDGVPLKRIVIESFDEHLFCPTFSINGTFEFDYNMQLFISQCLRLETNVNLEIQSTKESKNIKKQILEWTDESQKIQKKCLNETVKEMKKDFDRWDGDNFMDFWKPKTLNIKLGFDLELNDDCKNFVHLKSFNDYKFELKINLNE